MEEQSNESGSVVLLAPRVPGDLGRAVGGKSLLNKPGTSGMPTPLPKAYSSAATTVCSELALLPVAELVCALTESTNGMGRSETDPCNKIIEGADQ